MSSLLKRAYFKSKRIAALRLHRKPAALSVERSIVSFTFDDFPINALETAGALLESAGARGTYYAAFSLADKEWRTGKIGSRQFMQSCVDRGHELGCHTFSHLDCARTATAWLTADCDTNRAALDGRHPEALRQFAFPYGSFGLSSKRWAASRFQSARTVTTGISRGEVDLSALPAYAIDRERGATRHREVLESLQSNPGWAIFYTHDVAERPTEFGCTETGFGGLLSECVRLGFQILPVGEVVGRFTKES